MDKSWKLAILICGTGLVLGGFVISSQQAENARLKETIKKREATIYNLDMENKMWETQFAVLGNESEELGKKIEEIKAKQKELEVKYGED